MISGLIEYSTYFDVLTSAPLQLAGRCVQLVVVLFCLLLCGLWLPRLLLAPITHEPATADDDATIGRVNRWALLLSLSATGGVISCVTFWTLSLFAFHRIGPGVACVLVLAIAGLWGVRPLFRYVQPDKHRGILVLVTLAALAMGFWQFAATEVKSDRRVWLSDRHWDLSIHVHSASVIGASGLPKLNLNGIPDERYNPLCHTGYAVLIAGVSQLGGTSLYQASAVLWMIAYVLIGWSSLALVGRFQISGFASFVCAIAPLLWARVYLPMMMVMLNPSAAESFPQHPYVAALMYHNLPHVWSVAAMAGALVCLDLSATLPRRGLTALAFAAWAIAISGWIKPSQFILFVPALLIYLAFSRRRLTAWVTVMVLLGLGTLVYMLPALLFELPSHPSWVLSVSRDKTMEATRLFASGLGAGVLFAAARLIAVCKRPKSIVELDWGDVAFIAASGGYLFTILFAEGRAGADQPNIWWGVGGSLVLFSPYLVAWCSGAEALTNRARLPVWLRRICCCVVGIQLLNGLILVAVYPLIGLRSRDLSRAQALEQAGRATPPGTLFFVDPGYPQPRRAELDMGLEHPDLAGYLGRPVLYLSKMGSQKAKDELEPWWHFANTGDVRMMPHINRRDAIVLHESRTDASETLVSNGWSLTKKLAGGFQLFQREHER